MAKKRREEQRADRRVILWLVCCFPLGLMLMWRRGCRWPVAVKCAITACLALLIIAIVLPQTAPKQQASGGVQYVQSERSVSIYGPELPGSADDVISGYDSVLYNSATSVPVPTPEPEVTVYVANNGKYYHTATCRYYQAASRSLTLYEAYFTDYEPCPECKPGVWERKN